MKHACVILNGELQEQFLQAKLEPSFDIYVADGAFNQFTALNLPIEAILGDMDSITVDTRNTKVIPLYDQDYTDFDKIIAYLLSHQYQSIDVYGASGKEMDHFLGNLSTAKKYCDRLNIVFYDTNQYYYVTNKPVYLNSIKGKLISIFPFPVVSNLYTKGLQYNCSNQHLSIGQNIGIRNRAIEDSVSIEYKSGTMAIFISVD